MNGPIYKKTTCQQWSLLSHNSSNSAPRGRDPAYVPSDRAHLPDTQAFVATDWHLFVFTVVLPLLFHIFCRNNHVVRNNTKPYIFMECYATSYETIPIIYCDMMPESGNCTVREERQRHLLLDNSCSRSNEWIRGLLWQRICWLQQINCCSGCFLYGSCEVMKGEEFARQSKEPYWRAVLSSRKIDTSARSRQHWEIRYQERRCSMCKLL
jgi:hypothetical protein